MKSLVLHITSDDQMGIVAKYSSLLYELGINILALEQHVESDDKLFFMRIHTEENDKEIHDEFDKKILDLNTDLKTSTIIYFPEKKANLAIFASNETLHVYDILLKAKTNELLCNISCIVSNHKKLEELSNEFNIPFYHIDPSNSVDNLLKILSNHSVDCVALARYMQIIPSEVVRRYDGKIINIHHGFLPAFKGDRPYHKAWDKGVKIIGATSHYITEELDEGPIISQQTISVSHHHSVKQMIDEGRNLERNVLIDAIKAHLEHRIIIHGKRTIVFNR